MGFLRCGQASLHTVMTIPIIISVTLMASIILLFVWHDARGKKQ